MLRRASQSRQGIGICSQTVTNPPILSGRPLNKHRIRIAAFCSNFFEISSHLRRCSAIISTKSRLFWPFLPSPLLCWKNAPERKLLLLVGALPRGVRTYYSCTALCFSRLLFYMAVWLGFWSLSALDCSE